MYVIHKSPRVVETLRIEDGDRVLDLEVNLKASDMVGAYWRHFDKLSTARAQLTADKDSALNQERFGNAFVALADFVFGPEQREKIVAFYDENYIEMLCDLLPWLYDVVLPKLKAADFKRQAAKLKKYKA